MRIGWPRWLSARRAVRVATVVAALGVLYIGITFVQVVAASHTDDSGSADAIVVLGAAQYNGTPSPVFAARLDHARQLWSDGIAALIVTTGSKRAGDTFTEGFAGFNYLLRSGVPESDLLVITDGSSTWEQLAATSRQLALRDLDSVILVSDPYHALRLHQIASEVGLKSKISPTSSGSSLRQMLRETAAVSLGRILGYRRVDNWLGSVG